FIVPLLTLTICSSSAMDAFSPAPMWLTRVFSLAFELASRGAVYTGCEIASVTRATSRELRARACRIVEFPLSAERPHDTRAMSVSDPANNPTAPAVTAEGEAFPSAPRRLHYVDAPAPEPGQSVPIAPGVRWARIPLPLDLNHINVWLIETGEGCVVVDTGMAAS